ncbi:ESX secretion-associated protein EspG [Haloactinomyces albus]|uniref:EspG family protein n=1 Tax=Haloactinomyces albus TaxID=1352928 RepID=A0AAE3ZAY9_9ACTN|nr:ESX secretion-associated protein EspG [Haloactinomyces albus]MDR7301577.1 hypothetical protein [Haloactinomyces albus]
MVDTITLSVQAVDVLGEQLNLSIRQYPFEIPRFGASPEERSRVERQVGEELESAGLAKAGRPEPEVEDALYLLSTSEVSIAAAGLLDVRTGQWLAARVVATGEVGVLGLITNRGLRIDFMTPEDLPGVCVDLLPQAPPGTGEAVSATTAPIAAGEGHRDPSGPESDGVRAVESITGLVRYRLGHYVVTGIDRRGRRARLPGLAWFDTERGRYTLFGDRSPDGAGVLTCTPVDRLGMVNQLGGILDRARIR